MPLPAIDDQEDHDDDFIDMLDKVSLQSFTANPTAIGPFGASTLSWSATAPAAVSLKLQGLNVAKTGQRVVQPTSTTSYRLSAHAGGASKTLGTVHVNVNRETCDTFEINNPRSAIEAPVRAAINRSDSLYFKDPFPLIVSFAPGRIFVRLHLGKEVNNFSNPTVTIRASFGLRVTDGTLEPFNEEINISITVPWYAWLVPGAFPGLAIAIDMARESALKDVHEMIQGIAMVLDAFAVRPKGKRLSTVRVDAGNNGAGVVEFTACSHELLVRFSDLSGVVLEPNPV